MAMHIALHKIGVPFEGKQMSFKKNDMRAYGPPCGATHDRGRIRDRIRTARVTATPGSPRFKQPPKSRLKLCKPCISRCDRVQWRAVLPTRERFT
jgi:hypothetical protein